MVFWLRWLTVCWLVLAIPLQGMAAAAMGHGGAWRLPASAASAAQPGPAAADLQLHHPAHTAHTTHTAHPAAHAAVSADTQAAPAAPARHADTLGHSGHSGPHSCSVCAACCTALAMPPLGLSLPATAPLALWDTAPPQGRLGFVTGGPDRPPRPRLP